MELLEVDDVVGLDVGMVPVEPKVTRAAAALAKLTEQYLQEGGTITVVPPGTTGLPYGPTCTKPEATAFAARAESKRIESIKRNKPIIDKIEQALATGDASLVKGIPQRRLRQVCDRHFKGHPRIGLVRPLTLPEQRAQREQKVLAGIKAALAEGRAGIQCIALCVDASTTYVKAVAQKHRIHIPRAWEAARLRNQEKETSLP